MKMIFKYPLPIGDLRGTVLALPKDAVIRHVDHQRTDDVVYLWAEHENPPQPDAPRKFVIRMTGHEFEPTEGETFIGTVLAFPFVWHVYQLPMKIT